MKSHQIEICISLRALQLWFRLYLHPRLFKKFKKIEFQHSENLKRNFFLIGTAIYLRLALKETSTSLGVLKYIQENVQFP